MDKELEQVDFSKPTPDFSKLPMKEMITASNKADVADYLNGRDKAMHATVSGRVLIDNNVDDVQMAAVPCPPADKMKELSPEHEIFRKLATNVNLSFPSVTATTVFEQCGANYAAAGEKTNKAHR